MAQRSTPQIVGDTTGLKPDFLQKVLQAAGALGASQLIIHSGYRSPEHNAAVGGVSHSNHLTGEAIDGYVVVNGQQIPLGTALKSSAGQFGLRSGDAPGFYRGAPDTVHVDDAANMGGVGTTNVPTATPANSGMTTNMPTAGAGSTGASPLTAAMLDTYLRGKGSPLAGYGNVFIEAGQKYGVDPRLPVAISGGESSFGKNLFQPYNAWGWMSGDKYANWDQSIDAVTKGLASGYIKQGLTTIPEIGAKWAPIGASNDPTNLNSNWVRTNSQFYKELGGTNTSYTGTPVASALTGGKTRTTLAATPPVPSAPRALPAAVKQALAILRS